MNEKELQNQRHKTYTWSKKFETPEFNTSKLRSIFLEGNRDFEDCLSLIEEYKKEVSLEKLGKIEVKYGPWRMRLFSNLMNLLSEVINTKDRQVQKICAKDVN